MDQKALTAGIFQPLPRQPHLEDIYLPLLVGKNQPPPTYSSWRRPLQGDDLLHRWTIEVITGTPNETRRMDKILEKPIQIGELPSVTEPIDLTDRIITDNPVPRTAAALLILLFLGSGPGDGGSGIWPVAVRPSSQMRTSSRFSNPLGAGSGTPTSTATSLCIHFSARCSSTGTQCIDVSRF